MFRLPGLGAAAALLLVSGCSQGYSLPDRTSPAVKAEETRLEAVLASPGVFFPSGGTCKVRLLGREESSSFAIAECAGLPEEGPPEWRFSMPVRVDGDTVVTPGEGSAYSESVRRMFPRRLADYVLSHPSGLRP